LEGAVETTGITDIEPLRFHLLFERFINPDRLSYPDIDVDICMDRRQEVIDYTIIYLVFSCKLHLKKSKCNWLRKYWLWLL
jgi:hypothetical protein